MVTCIRVYRQGVYESPGCTAEGQSEAPGTRAAVVALAATRNVIKDDPTGVRLLRPPHANALECQRALQVQVLLEIKGRPW